MIDELAHEREDLRVIGGGGENDLAVTEGVLHALRHILAGEVVDDDLGAACLAQLFGEDLDRFLGVAVNGGIGDHDALGLYAVGRPCVVQIEVIAEVLGKHGTVQRADDLNIEPCRLFQDSLNLLAVFADDADIVAAGFTRPILFDVQRAELAEAVGGEQHLIGAVVGHQDLGPVDHGSAHEVQHMLAELEGIALFDDDASVGVIGAEEIHHHVKRLDGGYDGRLGIGFQENVDIRAVVGLHVLYDKVIGLSAAQSRLDILQPLIAEALIDGVHDRDFIVYDSVGIIRHTVGHDILALEQVDIVVVNADVLDIIGNKHGYHLPKICYHKYIGILVKLQQHIENILLFCYTK